MNTSQLADRMQEDQGEDGENNTYENAASLNDLYPVDGGDGGENDYDKMNTRNYFFLRTAFFIFRSGLSSKIKVVVRSKIAQGHEER
jgi:hypothetical protein